MPRRNLIFASGDKCRVSIECNYIKIREGKLKAIRRGSIDGCRRWKNSLEEVLDRVIQLIRMKGIFLRLFSNLNLLICYISEGAFYRKHVQFLGTLIFMMENRLAFFVFQ